MVKKKIPKKEEKASKKLKKQEADEDSGMSLDDAFADDKDVQYAKSKPRKIKKSGEKGVSKDEIENELDAIEGTLNHLFENSQLCEHPKIEASKPISKLKKGDKILVDGKQMEVDSHYLLINHSSTKEMAIELFDPKTNKNYQIRYFDDQVETTLELYELQEIMYFKKPYKKISW